MALSDNERIQEIFLVTGDKLSVVGRKWWIALAAVLILAIPAYFIIRASFTTLLLGGYDGPRVIYNGQNQEALQIVDKKIFALPNNTYSGYVKIRNVNLEWGVAQQGYTAEFKTLGGTSVNKITGSVFILPASEKLIIFPRFSAQSAPEEIALTLTPGHFIHKSEVSIDVESQRTTVQNTATGLVVESAVKNFSAFTIRQINLPVAVYNNKNEIVGVNFTYINDVKSGDTRTFKYPWPMQIAGAIRAEITPEVNIFDPNILTTESGTSPFANP